MGGEATHSVVKQQHFVLRLSPECALLADGEICKSEGRRSYLETFKSHSIPRIKTARLFGDDVIEIWRNEAQNTADGVFTQCVKWLSWELQAEASEIYILILSPAVGKWGGHRSDHYHSALRLMYTNTSTVLTPEIRTLMFMKTDKYHNLNAEQVEICWVQVTDCFCFSGWNHTDHFTPFDNLLSFCRFIIRLEFQLRTGVCPDGGRGVAPW